MGEWRTRNWRGLRAAGVFCAIFALWAPGVAAGAQPVGAPWRFDAEIADLVQRQQDITAHCPIIFAGSSSIRLWRSPEGDMAAAALDRGFGAARISDLNANFDARLACARAWSSFFYAGENEIAEGAAPEDVVVHFAAFLDLKDAVPGASPVHFISVRPSHTRLAQLSDQHAVNRVVRRLARARAGATP